MQALAVDDDFVADHADRRPHRRAAGRTCRGWRARRRRAARSGGPACRASRRGRQPRAGGRDRRRSARRTLCRASRLADEPLQQPVAGCRRRLRVPRVRRRRADLPQRSHPRLLERPHLLAGEPFPSPDHAIHRRNSLVAAEGPDRAERHRARRMIAAERIALVEDAHEQRDDARIALRHQGGNDRLPLLPGRRPQDGMDGTRRGGIVDIRQRADSGLRHARIAAAQEWLQQRHRFRRPDVSEQFGDVALRIPVVARDESGQPSHCRGAEAADHDRGALRVLASAALHRATAATPRSSLVRHVVQIPATTAAAVSSSDLQVVDRFPERRRC